MRELWPASVPELAPKEKSFVQFTHDHAKKNDSNLDKNAGEVSAKKGLYVADGLEQILPFNRVLVRRDITLEATEDFHAGHQIVLSRVEGSEEVRVLETWLTYNRDHPHHAPVLFGVMLEGSDVPFEYIDQDPFNVVGSLMVLKRAGMLRPLDQQG